MRRRTLFQRALDVTCPDCQAPPGEACLVNFYGKPDVHPRRTTLAFRADPAPPLQVDEPGAPRR